jgi:hypothetical protein
MIRREQGAQELVMSNRRDPYGQLTITDLQLIARARDLEVPAGADRDEIVALLRGHDAQASPPPAQNSTPNAVGSVATRRGGPAPSERTGRWTSFSIPELRNLARGHGIDVPAGAHRHELVELLVEHDVPRPSRPPSRRRWSR